jgi:Holliday junction resolvase RusA-like endonuclease
MRIQFSVQTKPVPQARPRFFVRHKGPQHFVGAYDPEQCKTFKEVIAWHAKLKAKESGLREPTTAPIVISLTFGMGRNGKGAYHTKRPDIDNLAKAVKDALKGIIYADDSQIVEAHLYKQYGGSEVRIEIRTLEEKG